MLVKGRSPGLAKLSRPRLARVHPRERLFLRLDAALEHAAVWVSGGPGAGKTTLVASYLDARKLSALWYHVDAGDTDPAVSCNCLQSAATSVAPQLDRELPALALLHTAKIRSALRQFFGAFYASIKVSSVLVVDDSQEALSSPAFREFLLAAINQAPNHIRLIITSRTRPPEDFARLWANADLVVMEADELLFSEEESIAVQQLTGNGSRIRGPEQMRTLHQITSGWPAGLKMLLQLAHPDEVAGSKGRIGAVTGVFEYLAAEFFDRLPLAARSVLLRVALLPRVTPAMAAVLAGSAEAALLLEAMHRDGSFTSAHGVGVDVYYEFHPLLREFLVLRSRSDLSCEEYDGIARKAAALLAQLGDVEAAAQVLMRACQWDSLHRLVLEHAAGLLVRGRHRALSAVLGVLPEGRLNKDPWLCYWHGAALLPFDPPAGQRYFLRAYRLFRELQISSAAFLTWSAIVDLICLEWSDFSRLDHWIGEAESLRSEFGPAPEERRARFTASMFGALLFRRPQDPAIHRWADRLLLLIEACPDASQRILLGCNLQMHYTVGVGFNEQLERLMTTIDPRPGTALTPLAETLLWALKSMYHWSRGHSREAAAAAENGISTARENGVRIWDFLLCALRAYAWLNSGELGRGRAALVQLEQCLDQRRKVEVAHYHYLVCLASLLSGDGAQALTQIETAKAIAGQYGGPQQDALGSLAHAQALHAVGRTSEAWLALEHGRDVGRSMRSDIQCFQADLCTALFALDQGDNECCARALQRAFAVGARRDYLNHNTFRPAVMARLCAFALANGIVPEYAGRLIRRRCLKPPALEVERWPWPVKIYTLGRFSIAIDGQAVTEGGRLPQKPVELLQALIAHGGRQVAIPLLIEAIWPEAESKGGRGAFETSLSRLRRVLGHDDSLLLDGGRLTLNPTLCWVDLWSFERLLSEVQATLHNTTLPDLTVLLAQTERFLRIYQGDFLGREECRPWALPVQERLRNRLGNALADVGRRLETGSLCDKAVRLYQRAIELEPLAENWYRRLMGCLQQQGEVAAALCVYRRCCEALKVGLQVAPSRETEAIHLALESMSGFQYPPGS